MTSSLNHTNDSEQSLPHALGNPRVFNAQLPEPVKAGVSRLYFDTTLDVLLGA